MSNKHEGLSSELYTGQIKMGWEGMTAEIRTSEIPGKYENRLLAFIEFFLHSCKSEFLMAGALFPDF
jgi:hypothetical protein